VREDFCRMFFNHDLFDYHTLHAMSNPVEIIREYESLKTKVIKELCSEKISHFRENGDGGRELCA